MKLVLIRHGESEWNRLNLFTGWTDVDLSEKGHEEARAAGKLLKAEGYDFDLCYTSYLKRAIHTLYHILDEMDRAWLPVYKSWKLNERHYGALQGWNKAETAAKYGDEQVKIWRRSFDVPPATLEPGDERCPHTQELYREVAMKDQLPYTECLKDCIARAWPYFQDEIAPQLKAGKRVLIAAHGNSLRALVMKFDKLTPAEILEVNIPTAIPLAYTFDQDWNVVDKHYIGDPEVIAAKIDAVANQGKAKK
jgi:2,3-bisphosphoglycerate-dependent phosphoglycerate mutase